MRNFRVVLYLALLTVSLNGWAKTVFVNDQLRVGVRPQPSQLVAPVGVVLTGMKLEVLATKNSFIKIRTKDGVEGWIKDIYVTDKTPAILRLNDIEQQQKISMAKIEEIEKTKKTLEEANSILNNHIDVLKKQRDELQRSNAIQMVSHVTSGSGMIIFGLIFCLLLGFAVGYFWYRRQSMRRLGGLRI